MKINLSQREIEYILFLISKSVDNLSDGSLYINDYTENDLELIDKLEHALKIMEVKRLGLSAAVKSKPLN